MSGPYFVQDTRFRRSRTGTRCSRPLADRIHDRAAPPNAIGFVPLVALNWKWRTRSMSYTTLSVQPLTPHIGAEIGGIDLTKPLSDIEIAELRTALTEHQVIFFRDQPISLADHERI